MVSRITSAAAEGYEAPKANSLRRECSEKTKGLPRTLPWKSSQQTLSQPPSLKAGEFLLRRFRGLKPLLAPFVDCLLAARTPPVQPVWRPALLSRLPAKICNLYRNGKGPAMNPRPNGGFNTDPKTTVATSAN